MYVKYLGLGLSIVGYLIPVCVLAIVSSNSSVIIKVIFMLGGRVLLRMTAEYRVILNFLDSCFSHILRRFSVGLGFLYSRGGWHKIDQPSLL